MCTEKEKKREKGGGVLWCVFYSHKRELLEQQLEDGKPKDTTYALHIRVPMPVESLNNLSFFLNGGCHVT